MKKRKWGRASSLCRKCRIHRTPAQNIMSRMGIQGVALRADASKTVKTACA